MPSSPTRDAPDGVTEVQPPPLGYPHTAFKRCPEVRWADSTGTHTFSLERAALVGAASASDVVVTDAAVSRLHAELDPRNDGVWVRDLGSRNGTFVQEVLVGNARVPQGGSVRVGSTTLSIEDVAMPLAVDLWPAHAFGPLIGASVVMRELFARLQRVAPSDATVLIHGETGTGKELVAEAIHNASPRADKPFVIVDCAALPENLMENELFGHARGAFTGATESRAGAIESADGGTVFLDEIGELPLSMQPKLLRAIESLSVRRLGESAHRKVDVRFVCATHRDLGSMVNAGGFREDLYFRLSVVPITVPPLRARPDDIPLLVEHFLPRGSAGGLTPKLVAELSERPWLGNVRELRNFVMRAMTLGAEEALALSRNTRPSMRPSAPVAGPVDQAYPSIPFEQPFKEIRERWVDHLEREYIRELLVRQKRNISAVADAAGLDRAYVYRLMKKHDL